MLNFLLAAFLWFDILGSISTRSSLLLELDHVLLLENDTINLERLVLPK